MRITKVTIAKFRSIKEASFRLGEVTAVVGENNAGKTAVLRALNSVLNFEQEREHFVSKHHQYAPRNNTYITLTLEDVPNNEVYSQFMCDGQITLRFSYSYSKGREKYELLNGSSYEAAPEDFMDVLSEDLMYVYVPAERTRDDLRCGENALFGRLVSKFFAQHVLHRDTVSSQVKSASSKMHDKVLVKLERELSGLYLQSGSADFRIDFPDDIDYQVFLSSIRMAFSEKQSSHPVEEWGSGTRSLAIIAMHRAYALLSGASIVLGIEEPETNLHPQAQRRFLRSLKNDLSDQETQALFTTHSTVLIDALGHDDILLVRRKPDERRGFHTTVSQIPEDFWTKYSLNDFKHYQYFRYKNSDFFFSKYVVVGESKNDCQVVEFLAEANLPDLIDDISFLDAGGVNNIKYPYFLLKELGIPCSFVVDRDFLFPYRKDNRLDDSRDQCTGLPKYGKQLKRDVVVDDLLPTENQRIDIESAHADGYRKLFSKLAPLGFLVMNHCLEMDLTCSQAARNQYYELLRIDKRKRSQKTLLLENGSAIKKIEIILKVLEGINPSSYPESYCKVKGALVAAVRSALSG